MCSVAMGCGAFETDRTTIDPAHAQADVEDTELSREELARESADCMLPLLESHAEASMYLAERELAAPLGELSRTELILEQRFRGRAVEKGRARAR